jgi:penicillin-binding protein 1A
LATVERRPARRRAPARRRSRRRRAWPALRRLLIGPLGLVLLLAGVVWYLSLDLADLKGPAPGEGRPQITLQDRAGVTFASFGDRYGEFLSLDQISPWLPKAVIAVEDRRF